MRGIQLAIEQELPDRNREITDIEREKLIFFAIKEFDLPITYSWYLAGAATAIGGDDMSQGPSPGPEFGELRATQAESDDVREYRDFFTSGELMPDYTLKDIWWTATDEFLLDFYDEFVPEECEEYHDIYTSSTKLRAKLKNLNEMLRTESEHATLSNFDAGTQGVLDRSDENEIRYLVSDVHMDLASTESVEQTVGAVSLGTDLIEHVLTQLTREDSLSSEQRAMVNRLSNFFYYWVWKYPALCISVETATGPNALSRKVDHLSEYDGFDEKLKRKIKRVTQQCEDVGLLPDTGAHTEALDEDTAAGLHGLTKEFIDNSE
ncbi:hypothetical protein AArcMg_0694 [Natrarchaeobaculum sulfurireducens]|uniref:DUF8098 domain-containing protein n=1 Tax=Natrarchaeobaculum sulfurireducens TaxID=2044521 RepID=A0A346PMH1_9EURY|nr:hypothetical protein AArcMg_0694 [Natrarchaeobaculum sulfurireducens]